MGRHFSILPKLVPSAYGKQAEVDVDFTAEANYTIPKTGSGGRRIAYQRARRLPGVCLVSAWCPLDVSVRVMLQSHYPFGASRRVTRLWRGASHRTPRRRTRRRRGAVRREWRVRCKRHDRSPLGNTSQRGRQPPRCLNRGVVAGPRPAPVIARQLRHATLERIWRAWSWQRSPARAGDESWWYHELAIWPSSTVAGG